MTDNLLRLSFVNGPDDLTWLLTITLFDEEQAKIQCNLQQIVSWWKLPIQYASEVISSLKADLQISGRFETVEPKNPARKKFQCNTKVNQLRVPQV